MRHIIMTAPLWVACVGGATPDTDDPGPTGALMFDGPTPRNVLIVSLDTARRDAIGRFGANGDTPELDGFLAESVVLADHRSCSNWTGPSMTCATSGRTPMENGFWPWSADPEVRARPPSGYQTIASHLLDAGFTTTLVTATEVYSSDLGLTAGFDREVRLDWIPAEWVVDAALTEIEAVRVSDAPWLVQVHFIDPHGTYCPPDGFVDGEVQPEAAAMCDSYEADPYGADDAPVNPTEAWGEALADSYREMYRGEVRYWDSQLGRFLDALDQSGALDDTLVVFLTDHGQQFFERGGHGHGLALGPEENRAAAAFWAKDLRPVEWTGPTVHQDVAATLFELYGVVPERPSSGFPVGTAPDDRAVRAMNYRNGAVQLSIVKRDRQLLYDWWGEKALYRLDEDPGALVDVYDPADPDVVDLWVDMEEFVADVRAAWPHLEEPANLGP
jgi:arylsulfatase A-like enzyme